MSSHVSRKHVFDTKCEHAVANTDYNLIIKLKPTLDQANLNL